MRTSNINLQFQINAGAQRNAGTLNKKKLVCMGLWALKCHRQAYQYTKLLESIQLTLQWFLHDFTLMNLPVICFENDRQSKLINI